VKLLDKQRENIRTEKVAATLGIEVSKVEFLIIKLRDEGYIREALTGLRIEDKGRQFVHSLPA
jgi:Mn-dependent DtxR family transcriptional regulator